MSWEKLTCKIINEGEDKTIVHQTEKAVLIKFPNSNRMMWRPSKLTKQEGDTLILEAPSDATFDTFVQAKNENGKYVQTDKKTLTFDELGEFFDHIG